MNGRAILAWGILTVTLVALADFNTTQELAVAFALLIFLTTALTLGPVALDHITTLVGGKPYQAPSGQSIIAGS